MANILTTVGGGILGTAADAVGAVGDAAKGTADKLINLNELLDSFNPIANLGKMGQNDMMLKQLLGQFGLSIEQMGELRDTMYDNAMVSASLWGKEMKDVVELQVQYNEATGRSIILGRENYDEQFAITKLIGDTGKQYIQSMQNFNQSVESAYSQFGTLYDMVEKNGLNLKKVSDTVVKNLQIADHITFRDGTAGLMGMAVWAERIRFSMQSIQGLVDKVTNKFEDSITMSAKLQVLGGPFAAMADPLAMMEEGFNDPESLAKRMASMIGNLATFDSDTGEFNLKGMYPQLAIRQYAEQTGISVDDARRSAKEQAKRQYIESHLGSDLTQEDKTLISSKAEYDKVNQKFYVRNYKGDRVNIEDINQSNITSFNSNVAADADPQTKMYTAAAESLGYVELLNNAAKTIALSQQQLLDKSWSKDIGDFGIEIRNTLGRFAENIKHISDLPIDGVEKIEHWFAAFSSLAESWFDTDAGRKIKEEALKLGSGNFRDSKLHEIGKKIAESFLAYIWDPLTNSINEEIESHENYWHRPDNGTQLLTDEIGSLARRIITPAWNNVLRPIIEQAFGVILGLFADVLTEVIDTLIQNAPDILGEVGGTALNALRNLFNVARDRIMGNRGRSNGSNSGSSGTGGTQQPPANPPATNPPTTTPTPEPGQPTSHAVVSGETSTDASYLALVDALGTSGLNGDNTVISAVDNSGTQISAGAPYAQVVESGDGTKYIYVVNKNEENITVDGGVDFVLKTSLGEKEISMTPDQFEEMLAACNFNKRSKLGQAWNKPWTAYDNISVTSTG